MNVIYLICLWDMIFKQTVKDLHLIGKCVKKYRKRPEGQRMAEAASNNLRNKVYVETASVDVQILHLAPGNAPRLKIQSPRLRLEKKVAASQFLKDQVSP